MPAPGFTEVQKNSGTGSGTSITVTLSSAPSSSNDVVIEIWANGNIATITPPSGFAIPTGGSTANSKSSGAVMRNTGVTATSYTVTLSSSSSHVAWCIREWSGSNGLGAASFGYYTASSSAITLNPTLTPQNSSSQLVATYGVVGNPLETINSSNWSNDVSQASGSSFELYSDLYANAAGSSSIGESVTFSAVSNAGDAAGIYEILPASGSSDSGALNVTLGSLTVAGAGTVDIAGTLTDTLGSLTISSTGTVTSGITGTLNKSLGSLTISSTGTVTPGITGAVSEALGAVTVSAAGTVFTGSSTPGAILILTTTLYVVLNLQTELNTQITLPTAIYTGLTLNFDF